MIVTKNEVRQLVDRLSKPKFNKRVEREVALVNQDMPVQEPVIITSRQPSKPTSVCYRLCIRHYLFIFLFNSR
jgi:hypothetical protein